MAVRRNLAVGSAVGAVCAQEQAWRQGKAEQTYHAWQLPNTYFGPHALLGRGRGRDLNRQLAGLRRHGDAGNGQKGGVARRYYENGASAGKGWGKCGRGVGYWPGKKARLGVVLWWVMEEPV